MFRFVILLFLYILFSRSLLSQLNGNMILIPTQNRLDSTVGSIATEQNVSELKTYITTVYPKNDSTGDYVMSGGSYTLIGMEYDNHQFGYQIAFGSDTKYRKLVSGNWGDWHSFVQKSDLGYVEREIDTVANKATVIPNSEIGNFYISVIIGHWSATNIAEHVFFQQNAWYVYSDVSQHIRVRLYKYPT